MPGVVFPAIFHKVDFVEVTNGKMLSFKQLIDK